MITREFNLSLNAGKSLPLVINVNQYDSGEQWLFNLYDDRGVRYVPSSGAIIGIKSDKKGIINSGSVVDGRVVIIETKQMTAAPGKAVFELLIDNGIHGTANFIVYVEAKPGDNADLSDSDLSMIQEAIDSTNPAAIAAGVSEWMDNNLTPTTPVIDTSLTVPGAAADAEKVGECLDELRDALAQGSGLTEDAKQALLDLLAHVITDDAQGQTRLQELREALYPVHVESLRVVFTQGNRTVFQNQSLDSLKEFLVVTAAFSDGSTQVLSDSDYELTGELIAGTSTLAASYEWKTATFTVRVIALSLPEGYTQYEYIQKKTAAGTSAPRSKLIILNSYTDMNVLSLEAFIGQKSNTTADQGLFGARMSSFYESYGVYNDFSHGLRVVCRSVETKIADFVINKTRIEVINPAASPVYYRVNGGDLHEIEWTDSPVITSPIMLFTNAPYSDTSTGWAMNAQARIGDIILRKADGECVGYYVPVTHNGMIGMYDFISETFYTAENASVVTVANSACLYAVGKWV